MHGKRQHFNELRTAANAMRTAGNLPAASFADDPAVTGTPIKANHILELRMAIDQARATLGLSAGVWNDPAIVPRVTRIRAAQIIAVRNSVK